jgi:hypothetical protein
MELLRHLSNLMTLSETGHHSAPKARGGRLLPPRGLASIHRARPGLPQSCDHDRLALRDRWHPRPRRADRCGAAAQDPRPAGCRRHQARRIRRDCHAAGHARAKGWVHAACPHQRAGRQSRSRPGKPSSVTVLVRGWQPRTVPSACERLRPKFASARHRPKAVLRQPWEADTCSAQGLRAHAVEGTAPQHATRRAGADPYGAAAARRLASMSAAA